MDPRQPDTLPDPGSRRGRLRDAQQLLREDRRARERRRANLARDLPFLSEAYNEVTAQREAAAMLRMLWYTGNRRLPCNGVRAVFT